MKPLSLLLALLLGLTAAPAHAQTRDYAALARQIVDTADIQPGEAVGVFGGSHTVPLMEAITIESDRRGGSTMMMLGTDAVQTAFWTSAPESAITQRPIILDVLRMLDVYIGLPSLADPNALRDIPDARFAVQQAQNAAFQQEILGFDFRGVFVDFPTEGGAQAVRMPFSEYQAQHLAALAADYDAISAHAERVGAALRSARSVRVTTHTGTDITFSVGDREPRLDDGRISASERASGGVLSRFVSLPGGNVVVAGQETSAQGRVVVPRTLCDGEPLRDVSFSFSDGVMSDFRAGTGGDCFTEAMAPYTGPKDRFGSLSIGLNPARQVHESGTTEYRPGDAAGMVWLSVGDNAYLGGANQGTTSFAFPLTGATVVADGTVLVREGRLAGM